MVSEETLMESAKAMLAMSYAPYSHFHVGAALLAKDGRVFTGCNVENAAYGPSNCAERTAFFKAVSEGAREFTKIVIVGGKDGVMGEMCPPCGVCRQVMREFCDPETFEILCPAADGSVTRFRLKDLLPESFGPANIT
ncbi:MAG: cytidine deaminase [Lachnospiraceae bacterium]|nr:cytidine deaminase [Lachnospiraceae bacterium]